MKNNHSRIYTLLLLLPVFSSAPLTVFSSAPPNVVLSDSLADAQYRERSRVIEVTSAEVSVRKKYALIAGEIKWKSYTIFPRGSHLHIDVENASGEWVERALYTPRSYQFHRTRSGRRRPTSFNVRLQSQIETIDVVWVAMIDHPHKECPS